MHSYLWCTLVLVLVKFSSHTTILRSELRFPVTSGFLLYRTNVINEKACTCSTMFSCSCCETVTIFYTKMQKRLCSNFMFQRNGLNVDISLGTDTIKTTTITSYRPFKLCTVIPGSIFSSLCVNVVELNQFPRSLTVCVRHEIRSKAREWQINYTCLGISTVLPIMNSTSSASAMIVMTTGATISASVTTTKPATSATTMMKPPTGAVLTMRPVMSTATTMKQVMSATTSMRPAMSVTTSMRPAMSATTSMRPAMSSTTSMRPAMSVTTSIRPAMSATSMRPAMSATTSIRPAMSVSTTRKPRPPSQMMITTTVTSMMTGNQPIMVTRSKRTVRPDSGQIRSMPSAPPSAEDKRTTHMMSVERRRSDIQSFKFRKIHMVNTHDSNHRARIVNGKDISKLGLISTVAPEVNRSLSYFRKIAVNTTDAVLENSSFGKIIMDVTDKPMRFPSGTLYDRSQNFPSRIPPVVEISLEREGVINSNRGAIIFITDNNKTSLKNNTDRLIFPD